MTEGAKPDNPRMIVLLFALLSVLPFLLVFEGPFLFDDESLIAQNPLVHSFQHASRWFGVGFWDIATDHERNVEHGSYFRPLVLLSYAVDWSLGDGSPVAFHVTNLVLAAVASALTMSVLLRWLDGSSRAALLAGVVFALHPSKAESIAWISGRPDLLMMIGTMLVLLGHAKTLGWGLLGRGLGTRSALGWALQGAGLGIAFLSKETAVLIPFMIGVQTFLFEATSQRGFTDRARVSRHAWVIAGHALVALSYVVARGIWLPFSTVEVQLSVVERALLFTESWGRYLKLLVLPADLSLFSAYKPLALVSLRAVIDPWDLAWGVVHGGLIGVGAWMAWRRRAGRVFVYWTLYVGCLLPVSNLWPMATDISISPRFLYLPLFALGALLGEFSRVWPQRVQKGALAGLLALGLVGSYVRGACFASSEAFWRYELAHNPRVPSVLGANAGIDEETHQPLLAAARRACAYAKARRLGDASGMSKLLVAWVDGVVRATPHSARQEREAITTWLDGVLREQLRPVEWSGVALDLRRTPLDMAALGQARAKLLVERAQLGVRTGDELALSYAERAVGECPGCADIAYGAARAAITGGDLHRAELWLRQAGIASEVLVAGLNLRELRARLAQHDLGARTGDPNALLGQQLLVDNPDAVVLLARLHPEWSSHLAVDLRLQVARAAHRVGEYELARTWLEGLMPEGDLRVIHEEWTRTSPAIDARIEVIPPGFDEACVGSNEML